MSRLPVVIAVALLAAGCATADDPVGAPATPTPSGSVALPAIVLECSGGIDGRHERAEIGADGTAVGTSRRYTAGPPVTLTAAERTALAVAAARAAGGDYRPEYRTENVADALEYTIRIGTGRPVTGDEPALPGPLMAVVRAAGPVFDRLGLRC